MKLYDGQCKRSGKFLIMCRTHGEQSKNLASSFSYYLQRVYKAKSFHSSKRNVNSTSFFLSSSLSAPVSRDSSAFCSSSDFSAFSSFNSNLLSSLFFASLIFETGTEVVGISFNALLLFGPRFRGIFEDLLLSVIGSSVRATGVPGLE